MNIENVVSDGKRKFFAYLETSQTLFGYSEFYGNEGRLRGLNNFYRNKPFDRFRKQDQGSNQYRLSPRCPYWVENKQMIQSLKLDTLQ